MIDVKQFLKLPDWKKMELKLSFPKFNNYPIQTDVQEFKRRMNILEICSYFSMIEFDYFMKTISQTTLDGLWPVALELFITPKILDIINIGFFVKYANCYSCEEFQGYNRKDYRLINKGKIKTYLGICKRTYNYGLNPSLTRVLPTQRCISWNPVIMIENLIDQKIKKILEQNLKSYYYKDYIKDLKTIDLWDYFQNRYKSGG